MNIVILAAGQGTRMRSALPKVLHQIAGKPLVQHVLDTARSLQPTKICVVYGHGGEAVPDKIGRDNIAWAKQEPQLGTGHAVMQAIPHLDNAGVTMILYGDVPLTKTATLQPMVQAAKAGKFALLTVELDAPTGYGRVMRNEHDKVTGIVEHKDANEMQRHIHEINTGIMCVPTQKLSGWLSKLQNNNSQKEYYLTDILKMAVDEGIAVETFNPEDEWETSGVNSKMQLVELERIVQETYAKALLEQGVTLADPWRIDIRGELKCGRDVSIDVNCVFEGKVSLADNVRIGANCVLKNVSVAAGAQIEPFSHIEDSVIGAECRIGPYARIRPGTVLAEKAHVGNFVEIKNSSFGVGSKANHLTYVGDTTVGNNVNIGAGTITCNYDGVNKHRTIIEDDVFIGSDTQLVAPVTVRRGATLGAGTTLTHEAPPDSLTISRAKQVNIPTWKRPANKLK
ncbi:MAG: bifunctional UDP-N-acetylglucosamine diphosphorylase/glucosamine-1-phosphate N-acetyltransferase GlmU [Burkholderiales bacterium]